ncbi:hypothetical protein ZWY2020_039929 [Hordeum vulgare]|nr:hypothetical protein ZWY2020_039929 [Hordeum vulgare]
MSYISIFLFSYYYLCKSGIVINPPKRGRLLRHSLCLSNFVVINDASPFVWANTRQGKSIAVGLSKLEKKGWRPRRTIIVYIWDAEEFVLVPDRDDRSHTLYDYMIRQNPPVGTLLSSTLESLHLTSLMDYIYASSDQDDWGIKAFPDIISSMLMREAQYGRNLWGCCIMRFTRVQGPYFLWNCILNSQVRRQPINA